MITFENVPTTTETTFFALPFSLTGDFYQQLKKANIPFKPYNRHKVMNRQTPNDMPFFTTADLQKFVDAGYDGTLHPNAICVIESNIPTDYLFEKCCLTFGHNMDPDFKAQKEREQKEAHEYYEKNKDWL